MKKNIIKKILKRIFKYLFLIFGIVICLIFIYSNKEHAFKNPFDTVFDFHYPYLSFYGDDGYVYILDSNTSGFSRLVKLDLSGKVIFTLEAGKIGKEEVNSFSTAAIDKDGFVYIYTKFFNIFEGLLERITIQKYNPKGKYVATLFEKTFDKNESEKLADTANYGIVSLNIKDGFLFFFYFESPDQISLYSIPITKGSTQEKVQIKKIVSIPIENELLDITGTRPGAIFYTFADGVINFFDGKLKSRPIKIETMSDNFSGINPFPLNIDKEGRLVFNEIFSQQIIQVTPNENKYSILPIFKLSDLQGYKYKHPLITYFSINNSGYITTVDRMNHTILIISPDGKLEKVFNNGKYSNIVLVKRFLLWLAFISILVLFLIFIINIYKDIMKRRIPFIAKYVFFISFLIIVSIYFTGNYIFNIMFKNQQKQILEKYKFVAQLGTKMIDGELLKSINSLNDFNSEAYEKLKEQMKSIVNFKKDDWNQNLDVYLYKVVNDRFYIIDTFGYDFLYPYNVQESYYDVLKYGNPIAIRYFDENGEWISGVSAIYDSNSKLVGILEISSAFVLQRELEKIFKQNMLKIIGMFALIFNAILFSFTLPLIFSIRKLEKMAKEITKKNYDVKVNIKSRDEIGNLGKVFNTMASELKNHINYINNLVRANSLFVPKEIIMFLNKKSIIDVSLGDQVSKTMSVMFVDIRDFTMLSEKLTPTENFNFLNSYLNRMGPIVRENNGYVDKYIGDGIMALFPHSPHDALKAGVEMKREIKIYNNQRASLGYSPIKIGIGINTGEIMLGIIGEKLRYEGTVISDTVNLASRIESLTKYYGISMVISDNTFNEVFGNSNPSETQTITSNYRKRLIDYVIVKGKTTPTAIYEIFEEDIEEQVRLKSETLNDFEKAISLFFNRYISSSLEIFIKINQKNPDDPIVKLYLNRCNEFLKFGLPENWEKAMKLEFK